MPPYGTPDVQPPIPTPAIPIPYGPGTGIVPQGYPAYGYGNIPAMLQKPLVKIVGVGVLMFFVGMGVGYSIGRIRRS